MEYEYRQEQLHELEGWFMINNDLEDVITAFAIDLHDEGMTFQEIMKEIKNTFTDYDRRRISKIVKDIM